MKTAILVFVLALGAVSASRNAPLKETIGPEAGQQPASNYPTYDAAYAHETLNKCYDMFIGPNGDEIASNADETTVLSGLKNCLQLGGMRYSSNTASALDTAVADVAAAKKNLTSAISHRAKALLTLDEGVDESEGEVEDGFDAANLVKMSTPQR